MLGSIQTTTRRSSNKTTTSAKVEDFAARFQREFSLCTGHVDRERTSIITNVDVDSERHFSLLTDHSYSASTSSTLYIDSGASSHMTGA